MVTLRVIEAYDGRLPIYHVVREVDVHDNCNLQTDKIIKSFDTYKEAEEFCTKFIAENRAGGDHTTPCGEEDPCS